MKFQHIWTLIGIIEAKQSYIVESNDWLEIFVLDWYPGHWTSPVTLSCGSNSCPRYCHAICILVALWYVDVVSWSWVVYHMPGDLFGRNFECRVNYLPSLPDHDDVIKWRHFPRYWPFVRGIHRSPVNSPQKGQWRGALMFFFICVWINGWVNNHEAGDLRRHRAHYDVSS